MITINSIKKTILLTGGLFLSVLSVNADDVQNKLNLDYFRTPEAAAFKKYGEEAVNEYTGTADISVPLYTIRCKDIEIPLVLRYDASGIKVEQYASWVGLGWNLMVGGCINYVCAGEHDRFTQNGAIRDQTWTEYLTYIKYPTPTKSFNYSKDDINTWMETTNHSFAFDPPYKDDLSKEMQTYLLWGYGERDFYSVNVLGKSFKFFIDPATLKPHIIGEAGEDYKIEPSYSIENYVKIGIGNQPEVSKWTITDADGYIYTFGKGDVNKSRDLKETYICSWYLTEIQSPLGEKVKLSYSETTGNSRNKLVEQLKIFAETLSHKERQYGSQGYEPITVPVDMVCSYVKTIETNNQVVTFSTSKSSECSGKRLDAISIKYKDGTGTNKLMKTINFTYGSFGCTNIGGNYASTNNTTKEHRLKLNNVKEIVPGDTLTTNFYYNELALPSINSCAQDYWGYYNGKDNPSTKDIAGYKGHTMLPTPKTFMNAPYSKNLDDIKGADRSCDEKYMQAGVLKKIVYPTRGYTTYEYESNRIAVSDYKQSLEYEEFLKRGYDVNILKTFSYTPSVPAGVPPVSNVPYNFTLKEELPFTLSVRCSGAGRDGQSFNVIIAGGTGPRVIPLTFKSSTDFKVVLQDKLPAGNYQLIIGAPSTGNDYGISCRLQGNYPSNTFFNLYPQKVFFRAVGGLRVKKISNYDNNASLVNYTFYDYNNSGRLLKRIKTIDTWAYKYINIEVDPECPLLPTYSKFDISGYVITQGKSFLPAFYESCNPGIAGYDYVTKYKYDANGKLEKSIASWYLNDIPEQHGKLDYYRKLYNGKLLNQRTYDANGKVMLEVKNDYRTHEQQDDEEKDKWFSTNMQAEEIVKVGGATVVGIPISESEKDFNYRWMVWKYPYILSRVDLTKITTTEYSTDGKKIVRTKEYKYKNNHNNIQVSQIDENTSLSNQTQRTKITYTADGTNEYSRWMTDRHRLNDVVENKVVLVENGKEQGVSTQRTNYTSRSRNGAGTPPLYYLPRSCSTSIGNAAPEERVKYTYDDSLNVRSIAIDGMETVYLWSYKGQYPIAKIEGLTYAEVENAITKSTISELLRSQTPNSTTVSSIRTKINNKGGYITTYTYKPLVGMLSETQPNGNVIYYEYDSFGRLKNIKDYNKKIIKTYEYHYSDKK